MGVGLGLGIALVLTAVVEEAMVEEAMVVEATVEGLSLALRRRSMRLWIFMRAEYADAPRPWPSHRPSHCLSSALAAQGTPPLSCEHRPHELTLTPTCALH